MFNELSKIIRISFIRYANIFRDEVFNFRLLKFCNEVLPFETQGSHPIYVNPCESGHISRHIPL